MYQKLKVVFWILVVIGGLWFVSKLAESYDQGKEKELDARLQRVCGVITNQQPNNTDLYDNCMDRGHEEFGP